MAHRISYRRMDNIPQDERKIIVYPNPTKNIITIETRLEIEIEVYDIMGKLLIVENKDKRIDMSYLADGLYHLSILHNNKRYNKQIIKQ